MLAKYDKKGIIKIFAVITAVLILAGVCFSVGASAVSGGSISIGSASGKYGDTVSVPVSISSSSGCISLSFNVSYDDSVVKLVDVTDGGILGSTLSSPTYSNPYCLSWGNDLYTTDLNPNGTLATLSFEIISSDESAQSAISISGVDGVNAALESVTYKTSGGAVSVSNPAPAGDDGTKDSSSSAVSGGNDNDSSGSVSKGGSSGTKSSRTVDPQSIKDGKPGVGDRPGKALTSDSGSSDKDSSEEVSTASAEGTVVVSENASESTDATVTTGETADASQASDNNTLVWVLIIVAVVLLAGAGVAIWFFVFKKKK